MDHVIDACPIYKSPRSASGIRELDDESISWLIKDLPV